MGRLGGDCVRREGGRQQRRRRRADRGRRAPRSTGNHGRIRKRGERRNVFGCRRNASRLGWNSPGRGWSTAGRGWITAGRGWITAGRGWITAGLRRFGGTRALLAVRLPRTLLAPERLSASGAVCRRMQRDLSCLYDDLRARLSAGPCPNRGVRRLFLFLRVREFGERGLVLCVEPMWPAVQHALLQRIRLPERSLRQLLNA